VIYTVPNAIHGSDNGTPLFRHPRLIAVAMLAVLAVAVGSALYVRPLSGNTAGQSAVATARSA
jgi:hypothetical protein